MSHPPDKAGLIVNGKATLSNHSEARASSKSGLLVSSLRWPIDLLVGDESRTKI
jgi:hypothetical protein